MSLMDFLRSLFGGKPQTVKKTVSKKSKTNKTEIMQINEEEAWWSNPVNPDFVPIEFQALDNNVAFQELQNSILKKKLEVIEIPSHILKILDLINQKEFNYTDVATLIEESPVLMGDFLSTANSAAFGTGEKISRVRDGLPRMGITTVKSILFMNSSKMTMPKHPLFREVAEEIVNHSMAVAKIAAYMSQKYYPDPGEAYMAGLLHVG